MIIADKSATSEERPSALIMAGGTGGHIFPGLAIAEKLQSENWDITWLGSSGGMEKKIVEKAGISIDLINVSGLRGNGILGWIKAPFTLLSAVNQSFKIITKVKPDLVIGMGGFVSGPGGLAAFLCGKPLIIHEQNAIAGLTNRILAKISKFVFVAFPNTLKGQATKTIGNPLREKIKAIDKNRPNEVDAINLNKMINVLVLGGSRGAKVFNQKLPGILASLVSQNLIEIHHQCGQGNQKETETEYNHHAIKAGDKIAIDEFIDDMDKAYRWADLVICRSGALTVSEISVVGIAAFFIPFPFAVDDHQTFNAKWLVDNGAAVLVKQSELEMAITKQKIVALVKEPEELVKMAANAKKCAYLNATDEIVSACNLLVKKVA